MTPGELRRLYFIVRVFLSYGLDELIPKMRLTLPLRFGRRLLFWMPNRHKDKPLGERLRLALQELGPVWIKFGQMMSTRRDLFPPQIADQLTLLQTGSRLSTARWRVNISNWRWAARWKPGSTISISSRWPLLRSRRCIPRG